MENTATADMLRLVFDKLPSPIFVVDDDVKIQAFNAAAAKFLSGQKTDTLKRRGDYELTDPPSIEVPEDCGSEPLCKNFALEDSITEVFHGSSVSKAHGKSPIITTVAGCR